MKMRHLQLPLVFAGLLFAPLAEAQKLTTDELAEAFHARGLAAEQREDYFAAKNCYALTLRLNPGHASALAKMASLEERDLVGLTVWANVAEVSNYSYQILGDDPVAREKAFRSALADLSRRSAIPITLKVGIIPILPHDFRVLGNPKTVATVLSEIAGKSGLVVSYERDCVLFSPKIIELTDDATRANVGEIVQFEGVVKRIDRNRSGSFWIRFEGTEFYLYCSKDSRVAVFGEAVMELPFKAGQRLKAGGKIGLHQGKPWLSLNSAAQWQVAEEELRAPDPADLFGGTSIPVLKHGNEPASSSDSSISPHLWNNRKGAFEFFQHDLPEPTVVEACSVYWSADDGEVRLPEYWKILYLNDDGFWMPVDAAPDAPAANTWNTFRFSPVRAKGLRLVAQLQWELAAGFLEWKILPSTTLSPVNSDDSAYPEELWLDDLIPLMAKTDHAPYRVNRYNREAESLGASVLLDGKSCRRFLFTHADAGIRFAVPTGYSRFSAVAIGPTTAGRKNYSWSFRVLADEAEVFAGPDLSTASKRQYPIEVDLPPGTKTITLIADPRGNNSNDHAIWANPRLVKATSTR